MLVSFEKACDEQGGLVMAKASHTLERMNCERKQGAPTILDIQSRLSNLRHAKNGRPISTVICNHQGCGKVFSRPDTCRDHCVKQHHAWFKGLPCGPANFCTAADKEAVDEPKARAKPAKAQNS